MTAKSLRDPVIVTIEGRTIEFTPCSADHEAYIQDGYLVLSCPKCTLRPLPAPEGTP